jgi:hypothetical protein
LFIMLSLGLQNGRYVDAAAAIVARLNQRSTMKSVPLDGSFGKRRWRFLPVNPASLSYVNIRPAAGCDDAMADAAVAVQTFGDFQNFHPHLPIIVTDRCFYSDGKFMACMPPDHKIVEELAPLIASPEGVITVDPSDFAKKGKKSVGWIGSCFSAE